MRACPLRVLVVDDDADSAESLKLLLELQGDKVRVACDRPAALGIIDWYVPDAAIIDVGLPDVTDGLELARKLRGRADDDGLILIAFSGWTRLEDQARGLAAGFDHYVTKPADPAAFEEILAKIRQSRTSLAP